jgi:hypothetical protein
MRTQDLKFCFSLIFTILLTKYCIAQVPIAPLFFGQNAWYSGDQIGGHIYAGAGQLNSHWKDIQDSKVQTIRVGGIDYDQYGPTAAQLIIKIDSIKNRGLIPIIQVPYYNGSFDSSNAKSLVNAINNTYSKGVLYWSIGNEPNALNYAGIGQTKRLTAKQIGSYIRSFAKQMKLADPTIKIIAPELTYYDSGIMDTILSTSSSLANYSIAGLVPNQTYGYVDYISFHYYPFPYPYSATRPLIVSNVNEIGKLKDNLNSLNNLINTANGTRNASNPLKIAITESNIGSFNDQANNSVNAFGSNSFIAGQLWADIISCSMQNSVQFLNFWSVIEGSQTRDDIGYLRLTTNNIKRSTYFHFSMIANNFKEKYYPGTVSGATASLKTFGSSSSSQIAVMIMNQESTTPFNYALRLDNNSFTSGSSAYPAKLRINCSNLSTEYLDTIKSQSTTLLIFNPSGNLISKTTFGLSDSLTGPKTIIFNSTTCGTTRVSDQISYTNYNPSIVSNIYIGTPSSIIVANNNKIFTSVSKTIIQGDLKIPIGKTLDLRIAPACP